ncbi:MAG: HEAT repeat domain-containing protein [Candidatus Muiribacteriota bacterium]
MEEKFNEYFLALSDKDWNNRKNSAEKIKNLLNNTFTKLDNVFNHITQCFVDGNGDTRYWLSEVFMHMEKNYVIEYLLDMLINKYENEELCFYVMKILKKFTPTHYNLYLKYFYTANQVAKFRLLSLFEDSYIVELKDFYREILKEKYWKLRLKGLDLFSQVASSDEIASVFFMINDENVHIYKRYMEIITKIEFAGNFNFKKFYNSILDDLEKEQLRQMFEIIILIKTDFDVKSFFEKIKFSSNLVVYMSLKLFLDHKYVNVDHMLDIISEDDRLVFWYIYSLKNSNMDSYDKSLLDFLNSVNHKMIALIILETLISRKVKVESAILKKLSQRFNDDEVIIALLKLCVVNNNNFLISFALKNADSDNHNVRFECLKYISWFKEETTIPHIIKMFDDKYWPIRKYAAGSLIDFGPEVCDYVKEFLNSDNSNMSFWSTYVFVSLPTEENLNEIINVYETTKNSYIKKLIIRNAARLDSVMSGEFINKILNSKDEESIVECLKNSVLMETQKKIIYENVVKYIKPLSDYKPFYALMFIEKFFPDEIEKYSKKLKGKKNLVEELNRFI